MKKINKEDMKIGEFIYIIDKNKGQKRAFIVKIMKIGGDINIEWWSMERKPNFSFAIDFLLEENEIGGVCNLDESDWKTYNIFKLSKKETFKFKKHLILKNLK